MIYRHKLSSYPTAAAAHGGRVPPVAALIAMFGGQIWGSSPPWNWGQAEGEHAGINPRIPSSPKLKQEQRAAAGAAGCGAQSTGYKPDIPYQHEHESSETTAVQ